MTATLQPVAAAMQRVRSVFMRRPEAAVHDDAPATARWQGGTRVVTTHAAGTQVLTDMPAELGGTGDQVTPGWLFRAGLASCATTSIVLAAAAEGIELAALEVWAGSRSDARGLLGMNTTPGSRCTPARSDVQLQVRIDAPGCRRRIACARWSRARQRCSPVRLPGPARRRRWRCTSTSPAPDSADHGRAVGNPACRAPGRRHLPQGSLHGALVLPVARALTAPRRCSSPVPSGW